MRSLGCGVDVVQQSLVEVSSSCLQVLGDFLLVREDITCRRQQTPRFLFACAMSRTASTSTSSPPPLPPPAQPPPSSPLPATPPATTCTRQSKRFSRSSPSRIPLTGSSSPPRNSPLLLTPPPSSQTSPNRSLASPNHCQNRLTLRTPPPRPPRPQTSLPNLRPRTITSPDLSRSARLLHLASPSPQTAAKTWSEDVLSSLPPHVCSPISQSTNRHNNTAQWPLPPDSSDLIAPVREDRSRAARTFCSDQEKGAIVHLSISSSGAGNTDIAVVSETDAFFPMQRVGWIRQHKRVLWMSGTIIVVLLAAGGLAAGIIWHLSVLS